jgi:glycosyltransferase involved in cell wall biosynthesis
VIAVPPKVTIVTPTKNRIKLLCETIESISSQTFNDWEHIIVDDGSDDGTAEVVADRAATDSRIRYLKRAGDKAGANVCRNIGIREARSELVVFLDSDDLLRSHSLGRRVEVMRRNPDLDFAVFPAGLFRHRIGDISGVYHPQGPGDDLLRFLSMECVWEISGPIWRRDFLEKSGRFDETLLSMQDLEMHVRAISAGAKYIFFADVDHDIRWNEDGPNTSVRHFKDPTFIRASEGVHAKLLDIMKSSGQLTWSRQRALVGLSFGVAECWINLGQFREAIGAWNRGCQRHRVPWYLLSAGWLMLCTLHLSKSNESILWRLVNKWKGWARFRQEPMLLKALSVHVHQDH